MSSSQQPSNNNNNPNQTRSNQLLNYETNETVNTQNSSQQSMSAQSFHARGQSNHGNRFHRQMHPYQEHMDENLADEFDTKHRFQRNVNDEDDSVFSDAVQDAFKKYQNEYSKYWTYNDLVYLTKDEGQEKRIRHIHILDVG
ncbi:hypothetical protein I4U23_020873 [Adineta vaga]|nr:hypothetical protein I4U23_020873 [Adineta vaga]